MLSSRVQARVASRTDEVWPRQEITSGGQQSSMSLSMWHQKNKDVNKYLTSIMQNQQLPLLIFFGILSTIFEELLHFTKSVKELKRDSTSPRAVSNYGQHGLHILSTATPNCFYVMFNVMFLCNV